MMTPVVGLGNDKRKAQSKAQAITNTKRKGENLFSSKF
jgi:hypothetical protein